LGQNITLSFNPNAQTFGL